MIEFEYDKYTTVIFEDSSNKEMIVEVIDTIDFISTPESFIETEKRIKKNIPLYEKLIELGVSNLYKIPFREKYYFIKDSKIENEIYYY